MCKVIWSSILHRNFFELDWALDHHNRMLDTFVPQTFVGNHDVTRIASKVGTDGAVLALVVLMTAGGIPSIYAGDEQGFVGVKEDRVGGDDAIRPAFPTDPTGLADWGYWLMGIHQNLIPLGRTPHQIIDAVGRAGGTASVDIASDRDIEHPIDVARWWDRWACGKAAGWTRPSVLSR